MADQAPATTPAVTSPCGAPGGSGGEGGAAGGAQGMMGMLFPLAIFILIFYFFIIRPQRKRQKQHDSLIGGISRGDQVITIGGIYGTIEEIGDKSLKLKIADGVVIEVVRSSVNANVTQQEAA